MSTPSMLATADVVVVVGLLLLAFYLMARRQLPQVVVMSGLACALLVLQGEAALHAAERAAGYLAPLALVLTSVAIPARMLDRARVFLWVAAALGSRVGLERLVHPRGFVPVVTVGVLSITFVAGGLLHGVTAALLMTPIIVQICHSYELPSRWLLCGGFVTSNLGGFSTAWGDVASHFQAESWHMTQHDFISEILVLNLGLLALLVLIVSCLTLRDYNVARQDEADTARMIANFLGELKEMRIDRPLLWRALAVLVPAIVLPLLIPSAAVAISALAILGGIVLERPAARPATLKSLGVDMYLVLGAVLVVAECVASSELGRLTQQLIGASGGATWSISLTAYLGAAFTGPGSWAAVVSSRLAALDPSHEAAWALGAGIAAGSSASLTAALAGMVVAEESQRIGRPNHVFTFRSYLVFGLPFSLFMLGYYVTFLTVREMEQPAYAQEKAIEVIGADVRAVAIPHAPASPPSGAARSRRGWPRPRRSGGWPLRKRTVTGSTRRTSVPSLAATMTSVEPSAGCAARAPLPFGGGVRLSAAFGLLQRRR